MKRTYKILLIAAIGLALVLFLYLSRGSSVYYECAQVSYSDIVSTLTVSGKITSSQEIEVKPRIEAYVSSINVKSGDRVSKGQLLMTLDAIPDMALLEDAEAQVELQDIALKQAELDFKRATTLWEAKSISKKEYEAAQNALASARELKKSAENKKLIISRGGSSTVNGSKVVSPIDGVVAEVIVHEGEMVNAIGMGSPGSPLCRIADNGPLLFKGNVDEIDIASISVGMPAELTLGALPSQKLHATISEIEAFGHTKNGYSQFEIKANLGDIPQGVVLRSGYSANAQIAVAQVSHVLSIPEGCIKFDENLNPYVLRLVSDINNVRKQEWEQVPVTLGINDKKNIQVLSGLNENDFIQLKYAGAK